MKAVAIKGVKNLKVVDVPTTKSVDGSVVMEIKKTGICGSDIHYWDLGAPENLVMGHEFCGVVIDPGERKDLKAGDRVTALPISPCGECPACKSGNPQYCPKTWSEAVGLSYKYPGGYAEYTSASVNTRGKREFLYGTLEVRARIPVLEGAWPAIWTLGSQWHWPSCGEIDVMEYYRIKDVPHILANAAWGNNQQYSAVWNSKAIPFSHFTEKDPDWAQKFHVWRMEWHPEYLRIYLDDELLNDIELSKTVNGTYGEGKNPFHTPQYFLLNLAIGGQHGGEPAPEKYPLRYEIDYIRFYQDK